jgi:hypothetical protein
MVRSDLVMQVKTLIYFAQVWVRREDCDECWNDNHVFKFKCKTSSFSRVRAVQGFGRRDC